MSGDPVRAALEAACQQDAFYGPGKWPSGYDDGLRKEYAEIIAAFLRALPDDVLFARLRGDDAAMLAVRFINGAEDFSDLAAAVTRAAQEDSGDGR